MLKKSISKLIATLFISSIVLGTISAKADALPSYNFWVYDNSQGFIQATYNQVYSDSLVEIYEDPNLQYDDAKIQSAVAKFEAFLPQEESLWGNPPDVDHNGKITICFRALNSSEAGAFYSAQEDSASTTFDGKDVINIAQMAVVPSGSSYSDTDVASIIAHETQHLIEYGNDPAEFGMVNEGLSMYTEYKFNNNSLTSRNDSIFASYFSYDRNTNISAIEYGMALDEMFYVRDNFGEAALTTIEKSPEHNIQSIADSIGIPVDQYYANFIDYSSNLNAMHYLYNSACNIVEPYTTDTVVNRTIKGNTPDWHYIHPNGSSLSISFTGDSNIKYLVKKVTLDDYDSRFVSANNVETITPDSNGVYNVTGLNANTMVIFTPVYFNTDSIVLGEETQNTYSYMIHDNDTTGSDTNPPAPTRYSVGFHITDGTNPLQNVNVTLASQTAVTDSLGNITFTNVPISNGIPYTITLDGYTNLTGTVNVVDQDVTNSLIMTKVTDTTTPPDNGNTGDTGTTTPAATIVSISDMSNTITSGDMFTLPSQVTANMSDNSTQLVNVTWDNSIDISDVGTSMYTGTVSGYTPKVKYTLTVNARPVVAPTIASIDDMTKTLTEGDVYSLPITVSAKMSDNTTQTVNITWDKTFSSAIGTVVYSGTVDGYTPKVKLTVTINAKPVVVPPAAPVMMGGGGGGGAAPQATDIKPVIDSRVANMSIINYVDLIDGHFTSDIPLTNQANTFMINFGTILKDHSMTVDYLTISNLTLKDLTKFTLVDKQCKAIKINTINGSTIGPATYEVTVYLIDKNGSHTKFVFDITVK